MAFAVGALLVPVAGNAKKAPKVGDPAPDFNISLLDHTNVSLADLKGQVVVINLWASWCVPCKEEMPMLDYMQRHLSTHGLRIIGVVTNDRVELWRVKNVAKVLGYSVSMYMWGNYPSDGGLPTSYVIDRKGIIRQIKLGSYTTESFAREVVPLLEESAG
jgi:cytochrome c biogenesis protein CcmG/thiol:disulfide interchange protein DsbE